MKRQPWPDQGGATAATQGATRSDLDASWGTTDEVARTIRLRWILAGSAQAVAGAAVLAALAEPRTWSLPAALVIFVGLALVVVLGGHLSRPGGLLVIGCVALLAAVGAGWQVGVPLGLTSLLLMVCAIIQPRAEK